MDEIEFVVADKELGIGRQTCAEPVINGTNLVDAVTALERKSVGYAGLPPDVLARNLRQPEPSFQAQVLRCICGDDGCSWARVTVNVRDQEVIWREVRASGGGTPKYDQLGPYRFRRDRYEHCLQAL